MFSGSPRDEDEVLAPKVLMSVVLLVILAKSSSLLLRDRRMEEMGVSFLLSSLLL